MVRIARPSTLTLAVLLLTTTIADAALTTQKCLVMKRQAWGTLRKCEASEQTKQLKGKPADLVKCQTKFQETLAKVTEKARVAAIPCRYGDNGNRTVTDYDTGLQWEKKSGFSVFGLDGFVCPLGGDEHCVNNMYTWNEANRFVDASGSGATLTSCFFGYCDWRLPTIVELQTTLLEPFLCSASPCIDPIFGPTETDNRYWSATTIDDGLSLAWNMSFDDGLVSGGDKGGKNHVRAVRAGL